MQSNESINEFDLVESNISIFVTMIDLDEQMRAKERWSEERSYIENSRK